VKGRKKAQKAQEGRSLSLFAAILLGGAYLTGQTHGQRDCPLFPFALDDQKGGA
jgi:hypothetical protein